MDTVRNIFAKLPPNRQRVLQAPLDAAAARTLAAMGNRLLRPVLNADEAKPLVDAGYARPSHDGGFVLTDAGQFRAMMEAA